MNIFFAFVLLQARTQRSHFIESVIISLIHISLNLRVAEIHIRIIVSIILVALHLNEHLIFEK